MDRAAAAAETQSLPSLSPPDDGRGGGGEGIEEGQEEKLIGYLLLRIQSHFPPPPLSLNGGKGEGG